MKKHALPLLVIGSAMAWSTVLVPPVAENFSARVLKPKATTEIPWVFLTKEQLTAGAIVPANTNVVFTLPAAVAPSVYIHRETLLGGRGKTVRYWGYCFPKELLSKVQTNRQGLPGDLFLSEAERAARDAVVLKTKKKFSALNPPKNEADLRGYIQEVRHQREFFKPNETCYITTGTQLSIGIDPDGDLLNTRDEQRFGTDLESVDTDGDGIMDGVEALRGKTSPLKIDTDGDRIPDGTEDADKDGRMDTGETNALDPDTDGDFLCDGYCELGVQAYNICPADPDDGECVTIEPQWESYSLDPDDEDFEDLQMSYDSPKGGEDKNLNGVVDAGETDPRKAYTYKVSNPSEFAVQGDAKNDFQRFLECVLEAQQESDDDSPLIDC